VSLISGARSRRDVSGHLRILDSRQAEIANLEVAVLVYQNIGWLEISMDGTGVVDVFQPSKDLIQEVLDELLLERT
jgi:hypothetical protein